MREVRELEGIPPHADPREAIGIVLICFGWFILGTVMVMSSPGVFAAGRVNDNNFIEAVLVKLVFGATALAVLHTRAYPLYTLCPRPSWRGIQAGVGLYLCCGLLTTMAYRLVPPQGASMMSDLVAAAHVSWYLVVPLALVNGSYDEIFLSAYLMRGLRRFGASTAIGISVLVRVLYSMHEGPMGALAAALFGVVLGIYYQYRGRLFPVVLANVIADVLLLSGQSA